MSKNQKFHYYAVSGNVVWRSEDDQNVHQVMNNSLIALDQKNITQHALGLAQQGLMKSTVQKVGVAPDKFVDVVVVGLNYLGHMTEKEFYTVPEGQALKQVQQAKAEVAAEEAQAKAEDQHERA